MSNQTSASCRFIGLYLGDTSHAGGLWQEWLPLFRAMGLQWVPLWDRSFLSADLLAAIDVILVPGGLAVHGPHIFGGETGRNNLQHAIRRGASFVGFCYGAAVAMSAGAERDVCRLGLIEGAMLGPDGLLFEGVTRIDYAGTLLPYIARGQQTQHIYGRMFGNGAYEVLGRFSDTQPGPFDPAPQQPIAGRPAAITASYGRGRAFAFCSHPEHPISGRYADLLSQVLAGEIAPLDAAQSCQEPPRASAANMELLKCLFHALPRAAIQEYPATPHQSCAEYAAYLATAKDLLLSRLREIRQQLLGALMPRRDGTLEFVREVLHARLQQAQDVVGMIDVDALWDNPEALSRTATCFVLQKLYCGCDLPQYCQGARMDHLLKQLAQFDSLPATVRTSAARSIVHWIFRVHIADLERVICLKDR